MWVCRAGQSSIYYEKMFQEKKIYILGEGYNLDFHNIKTVKEFRDIVIAEKGTENRVSVSNRVSQLNSFCNEMKV